MIVATGAAGFIGSCLAADLLRLGHENILLVDDFSIESKKGNLKSISELPTMDRMEFIEKLSLMTGIEAIIHIGARTDTTEFDYELLKKLNLDYTKAVWKYCAEHNIPLIYASSAATYGNGEYGYDDSHDIVNQLEPLNPYGISKNEFDKWALQQEFQPQHWYGLKFFNVYGPNEYHKSRMASVIMHAFNQITSTGKMKLFKSHNPNYKDGGQLRDFVYVKDVVSVIEFLLENKPESGLYNLGTGTARTFEALAKGVFRALDKEGNIEFIDTPEDIRDKYQYFTEANMTKLQSAGYEKEFTSLEAGIEDYVKNYLVSSNYY